MKLEEKLQDILKSIYDFQLNAGTKQVDIEKLKNESSSCRLQKATKRMYFQAMAMLLYMFMYKTMPCTGIAGERSVLRSLMPEVLQD